MAAQTLRASNGVEFKVYNVTKDGKQVVLLVDHSTGRRRILNCADVASAQKRANAIAAAMLKGQAARQAVSEADWQQAVVALGVARRNGTPLVEALKEWAICHANLDGKATISEAARHRRCTPAGRARSKLRTVPPPHDRAAAQQGEGEPGARPWHVDEPTDTAAPFQSAFALGWRSGRACGAPQPTVSSMRRQLKKLLSSEARLASGQRLQTVHPKVKKVFWACGGFGAAGRPASAAGLSGQYRRGQRGLAGYAQPTGLRRLRA